MTKYYILLFTQLFIFKASFCQDVTVLQNELNTEDQIQLFISNYDSKLKKIIIHSSFLTDTSYVDTLYSNHKIILKVNKEGVYNLRLQFLDKYNQIIKESTSKIKVLEKSFFSKYEKVLGPILGAFIATVIFILNYYISSFFQTQKAKNIFKLSVNRQIDKVENYNASEEYLNNLTTFLLNDNNSLYLPYSDKNISQKADQIRESIYDYKSKKINFDSLITKLKTNKLK